MVANQSAGHAALIRMHKNSFCAPKSGPIETEPTVPVATALLCENLTARKRCV